MIFYSEKKKPPPPPKKKKQKKKKTQNYITVVENRALWNSIRPVSDNSRLPKNESQCMQVFLVFFYYKAFENPSGHGRPRRTSWMSAPQSVTSCGFDDGPNLLFLAFLVFHAFFLFKEFLAILSVFPFFPKDFWGSASRRNPCFFGGFPCCFRKRQGKEDQGGRSFLT